MALVRLLTLTSFLSAALLFMVQPLVAKMLLPLLGGTPAVWNTCQMFFQIVLLAGYGYAHWLTSRCSIRTQGIVHGLLILAAGIAFVPIQLPIGWSPPGASSPIGWVLVVLTISVGAPFFALSATAPLLQRWLAEGREPESRDPYFLYAASNLGSLGTLLAYPFVLEPLLRLKQQTFVWAIGYAGFAIAILICCLIRIRSNTASSTTSLMTEAASAIGVTPHGTHSVTAPSRSTRLLWLLMAFIPSSWMLGVTTHLTTDLTPVPLLWIVPLSIYLLTFVIVFSSRPLLPHWLMQRLLPAAFVVLAAATIFRDLWAQVAIHLTAFSLGAMVCHGELARRRPPATQLTEFYFWMSLGGCLGGVFHALIAPVLFPLAFEYPITIAVAAWLCGFGNEDDAMSSDPNSKPGRPANKQTANSQKQPVPTGTDLGRVGVALLGATVSALMWFCLPIIGTPNAVTWMMLGVPALLALLWFGFPKVFTVLLAAILLSRQLDSPIEGEVLFTGRSFFGIHRVVKMRDAPLHQLVHGATIHGIQSTLPERRCEPLAYYHTTGPLGDVFAALREQPIGQSVALVGLGAGATVSYAEPNRRFTLYEIDPVVKQIAETPGLFQYLSGCGQGRYEVVLGDGRLKLKEAPDRAYGLMIFDAFSSDAIPLHLLTREAFEIYLKKLDEHGWLVFHVSNLHLDLVPVLADLAKDRGLTGLVRNDLALSEEAYSAGKSPATYVVLARDPADLLGLPQTRDWTDIAPHRKGVVWTDDYANVLGTLKWYSSRGLK